MPHISELAGVLGPEHQVPMPSDLVRETLSRHGLSMIRTCSAAPEQYEVFRGDEAVGYFRVRWSGFIVDYPIAGGECLYDGAVQGFAAFDDSERDTCLLMAIDLLVSRLEQA